MLISLPDETKACRGADAILLAAIGSPQYDGAPIRPEQGLLALRKEPISLCQYSPWNF